MIRVHLLHAVSILCLALSLTRVPSLETNFSLRKRHRVLLELAPEQYTSIVTEIEKTRLVGCVGSIPLAVVLLVT